MKFLRPLAALLLLLWLGAILAAFFVTQRPIVLQVAAGISSILATLALITLLLVDAACLGIAVLRRAFPFLADTERLLLGAGLGLGALGMLGFLLAALGAARAWVLISLLAGLLALAFWRGWLRLVQADLSALWQLLRIPSGRPGRLLPWLAAIAFSLSFVLAFAPPADAFDALFYHLVVPQAWLDAGGIVVPGIVPHAWFPGLGEGLFVWGLGLGNEQVPQFLHLAFAVLSALIIWVWAQKVAGNLFAWRAVVLLASMPALPLLAAWAYTDLALAFYTLAVLYLLWRSEPADPPARWALIGIFCGMGMGIKYTSFLVPLFAFAWLLWTLRRSHKALLRSALTLILSTILVASPWYLRNWILMGNPVYPFLFGGRFWDPFLAASYQSALPGIGWDLRTLLLMPFTITFGIHDVNYYDGRIGPLWLALLPVCLLVLWRLRRLAAPLRRALALVALFGGVSLAAWVLGVVNTRALWQTRLLFPALLPLALLAAAAWERLADLDLPRLRLSFIFNAAILLTTAVLLFDFSLFVYTRHPLASALGTQDRQAYFERFQPAYADALALVAAAPAEANVYFLYEPRSYGMTRTVQPDPFNANLTHLFQLHTSPEAVLAALQQQGVTHVLYQRIGDERLAFPEESRSFFALLALEAETARTQLYRLP